MEENDPFFALSELLTRIPAIGRQSARAIAHSLFRQEDGYLEALSSEILELHNRVHLCPRCFNFAKERLCPICSDQMRDKSLCAVVQSASDLQAIERSAGYKGSYFVLGALLSPLDGIGPEEIHAPELMSILEEDEVKEVVLATPFTIEGDLTARYIAQEIGNSFPSVFVSRIASGLPAGRGLSFAGGSTLLRSVEERRPFK